MPLCLGCAMRRRSVILLVVLFAPIIVFEAWLVRWAWRAAVGVRELWVRYRSALISAMGTR